MPIKAKTPAKISTPVANLENSIRASSSQSSIGLQPVDPSNSGLKPNTTLRSATRCLVIMNLDLRGIEADLGPENADTFRRALIEADLVDCMVALPGQLYMATEKFNVALAA